MAVVGYRSPQCTAKWGWEQTLSAKGVLVRGEPTIEVEAQHGKCETSGCQCRCHSR